MKFLKYDYDRKPEIIPGTNLCTYGNIIKNYYSPVSPSIKPTMDEIILTGSIVFFYEIDDKEYFSVWDQCTEKDIQKEIQVLTSMKAKNIKIRKSYF